jgi:hypothetical protein
MKYQSSLKRRSVKQKIRRIRGRKRLFAPIDDPKRGRLKVSALIPRKTLLLHKKRRKY